MKKILINYDPWQTRIAITVNGRLENIYFSTPAQTTLERAYFKGVVTTLLPGIQTAFVDIGQEKAGFLHISEIDRELAIENISKHSQLDDDEQPKKERERPREKPNIVKILKEGELRLVQVSKEPMYEKGAKLTTCFTLPGRFIVLMPNIPRIGVSKKIEEREERARLKKIVSEKLPEGMGAIIRTTCQARDSQEIVKDLNFLVKTWNEIQSKFQAAEEKSCVYEDLPLAFQIVRDHLDEDVEAVVVDNKTEQYDLYKFVQTIAPEFAFKVQYYAEQKPLFQMYDIDKQIQDALRKKVYLKSGGSLIIETAEAMTVIDVNTGRFTGKSNLEETIFKTNIEAAEEVVRQLKIRNIGGLIVIDFIDMASHGNRQKLFNFFERVLKEHDKFQSVVLKVSEFGLVQMTRKRSGKTLLQQMTVNCPMCHGIGFIKSAQTECFTILRQVKDAFLDHAPTPFVTIELNPHIFDYLARTEYNALLSLEKEFKTKITLRSDSALKINEYKLLHTSVTKD